jgi:hypothetical protein
MRLLPPPGVPVGCSLPSACIRELQTWTCNISREVLLLCICPTVEPFYIRAAVTSRSGQLNVGKWRPRRSSKRSPVLVFDSCLLGDVNHAEHAMADERNDSADGQDSLEWARTKSGSISLFCHAALNATPVSTNYKEARHHLAADALSNLHDMMTSTFLLGQSSCESRLPPPFPPPIIAAGASRSCDVDSYQAQCS